MARTARTTMARTGCDGTPALQHRVVNTGFATFILQTVGMHRDTGRVAVPGEGLLQIDGDSVAYRYLDFSDPAGAGVRVAPAGATPRTTSGKLARRSTDQTADSAPATVNISTRPGNRLVT